MQTVFESSAKSPRFTYSEYTEGKNRISAFRTATNLRTLKKSTSDLFAVSEGGQQQASSTLRCVKLITCSGVTFSNIVPLNENQNTVRRMQAHFLTKHTWKEDCVTAGKPSNCTEEQCSHDWFPHAWHLRRMPSSRYDFVQSLIHSECNCYMYDPSIIPPIW